MLYFLDRNFSKEAVLIKELMRIYGIGYSCSKRLCVRCGVSASAKVGDLDILKIRILVAEVRKTLQIDSELLMEIKRRLIRKRKILTNQGIRYKKGLPVRGQRTHTNGMSSRRVQVVLE